jgi:hypothetical protein
VIDWTSQSLRLVYLVAADFYYDGGTRTARWCGPTSRCGGGGLVLEDPDTGTREQWEARLSGGRLDRDLGGLMEGLARVASASFSVDAGGPDSAGLRAQIRDGRWVNRPVRLWLHDLDSGAWQHGGTGEVDREPTAWGDGSFSFSMRIWPFPDATRWPSDEVPRSVPTTWDPDDDPSVPSGEKWHPSNGQAESYQINGDHRGKQLGRLFGGMPTPGLLPGIAAEIVPYGMLTQTADYIFCWISSVELCFAAMVWWEADDGVFTQSANATAEARTFINRDPTRGPLGTCVRIRMDSLADSEKPRWWAPDVTHSIRGEGAGHRIYALLVGPGYADFPPGWDALTAPFLTPTFGTPTSTIPASTYPWRGDYAKLLEDLDSAPWLNSIGPFLGTNAIADFVAAAPTYHVDGLECRIPYALIDDPPSMREVVGELMTVLQADLCWRLDTATERMAIYPIWRGPRPGQPVDWTITAAELVRVEQPRPLQWDDDPFRDYATRVVVKTPSVGLTYPFASPPAGIGATTTYNGLYLSVAEESAAGYGGKLRKGIDRRYWLDTGSGASARNAGEHHCQRQRQSVGTLGPRGMQVQQGDLIAYSIDDYPTAAGQVRKTAWDLDAVTATIAALHIEAFPDDGDAKEGEGK